METQLPSPKRGTVRQFSAHVRCGLTAWWIKMPLGMEVGLSPVDNVLNGDRAPTCPPKKRGHSPLPNFWPMSIVTVAHVSYCWALVVCVFLWTVFHNAAYGEGNCDLLPAVYTIQPVVTPVWQPVWQQVISCKGGFTIIDGQRYKHDAHTLITLMK